MDEGEHALRQLEREETMHNLQGANFPTEKKLKLVRVREIEENSSISADEKSDPILMAAYNRVARGGGPKSRADLVKEQRQKDAERAARQKEGLNTNQEETLNEGGGDNANKDDILNRDGGKEWVVGTSLGQSKVEIEEREYKQINNAKITIRTQNKHEIGAGTFFLMVGTAMFYDIFQLAVEMIPVLGQILSVFITFFAFLTFWTWFKIHGRNFASPKRAIAMGAGVIIELIPVLNVLPGWTVAVLFLVGIEKAEKLRNIIPGGNMIKNNVPR